MKKKGRGRGKDDDLLGVENEESDGEEEDNEVEEKVDVGVGIKKVRMGTFEDSGVCTTTKTRVIATFVDEDLQIRGKFQNLGDLKMGNAFVIGTRLHTFDALRPSTSP